MSRSANRGLGIDWNFDLHEGQINNRGSEVIHEIGLRCTCNKEDVIAGMIEDGPHALRKRTRFGCEICGGDGFIYRNPAKVIAMFTDISGGKTLAGEGWLYPGDSVMSLKPGYEVSTGDKISYLWAEPVSDGQVVIRGAAQIGANSSRKLNLEENEDLLWYHAIHGVYCEDDAGKVYASNVDFLLDGSRVIRWIGNRPRIKQAYSIKYEAYLEWIAFMPPDHRRDRDRDLGSRVALRKRHVAIHNDNPSARITDRVPFCERVSSSC